LFVLKWILILFLFTAEIAESAPVKSAAPRLNRRKGLTGQADLSIFNPDEIKATKISLGRRGRQRKNEQAGCARKN
jgi:hypothetical protein